MAEVNGASVIPTGKSRITLHVLSPSSPRIIFENISVSTTVLELKAKISETSPTHPPVAAQRLIYQGHPIVQGDKTLRDIFTQQKINESDTLTLHIVTPPSNQAPNPSPQPHIHNTNTPPPQPLPQATPSTGVSPGVHPPGIPSRGLNGQPQLPVNFGQSAPFQGQFPAHLQQSFAQFQAIHAQLAAQLASLNNHPIMNGQIAQQQAHMAQAPTNQPQHHTQQRDSHHEQQIFGQNHQSTLYGAPHQQHHGATMAHMHGFPQHHFPQPPPPPNSNTVFREHIGPNGQRWSTVTHTGTMNINTPVHINQHPGAVQSGRLHSNRQSPRSGTPSNQYTPTVTGSTNPPATNIPTHPDANDSNIPQHTQNRTSDQREIHGTDTSAIYILSSPSGPQALLVSPSGSYTAPWHLPVAPNAVNYPPISPIMPNQLNAFGTHGLPNLGAPQGIPQAPNQALHAQQAQAQQGQQMQVMQVPNQANAQGQAGVNQQQQQQQQARDLARILVPVAGHAWLFVRLFGFVWFFTHGASWTRTILLCLIATLVFIGQSGFFRPVIQEFWEPIRQHAENLFPLAGNERPGVAEQLNVNATGAQGPSRGPNPADTAQRLLDERQRQDTNLVRAAFRRCERAAALFLASLAPGVAERYVRARTAEADAVRAHADAEAMRAQEEDAGLIRQRASHNRLERQPKEGAEERRASVGKVSKEDENAAGDSSQGGKSNAAQASSQPPVIEV